MLADTSSLPPFRPLVGMFGFDGDERGVVNFNTNRAVVSAIPRLLPQEPTHGQTQLTSPFPSTVEQNPLKLMDNKKTAQWFGNGLLDFPPADGVFLEVSRSRSSHSAGPFDQKC